MKSKISRAKRKDNKEWVEGYYFCMVHDDKLHEHHFIIPIGADLSKGTPIEQIQVEIDIETLCDDTDWIPCNERLPEANERMKVWVTIVYPSGRHTRKVLWNGWCFEWSNGKYIDTSLDKIVAWKPYHGPEPWRGDADAKEK